MSNSEKVSEKDFWTNLQIYLGNSIPNIIVELCKKSGYDNALSFLNFDESDINTIEIHARQNAIELLEESEVYSTIKPFEFLPGHRKILLTLESKIKSFINRKNKKNLFKISETEGSKLDSKPNVEETVELLTDNELNGIKSELLNKLNVSAKTIGLKITFSEQNIVSDIEPYISQSVKKRNTASYKCMIKCGLCCKRVPCTYIIKWQTGNFDNHLKTHAVNLAEEKIDENVEQTQQEKDESSQLNSDELNSVLGLSNQTNSK